SAAQLMEHAIRRGEGHLSAVLAVWALARRLLAPTPAWIAAALFAVHPVHTEAVAVAVGQGESLVTALSAGACVLWLDLRDGRRSAARTTLLLTLAFLAALGLKEHALVLPALLLLLELLAPQPAGGSRDSVRARHRLLAGLVVLGAAFWALRTAVLGDLAGADPADGLAGLSFGSRALTMLSVVPEWARLLIWPAHLQADYAPNEIVPFAGWTSAQTLGVAVLLIYGALLAWSLRRRRVVALGLVWIAIALAPVANIFVPTGVILAERTLMLASVGAIVTLLGLIPGGAWEIPRVRTPLAVAIGMVIILGALHSAARLGIWRDTERYILALAVDAPDSWHTHLAVGTLAFEQGDRRDGEAHLRAAIAIWPDHSRAYRVLAREYRLDGLCAPAIPLLERAVALEPIDQYARLSLVACLLDQARYREAGALAREGIAGPGRSLEEAFGAAARSADRADRLAAPRGTVRLAPFGEDQTTIGPHRPASEPRR
ncbi:MAG: hypothetical protein ABJB33_08190, partial [Gemmatimonadota bacterium]